MGPFLHKHCQVSDSSFPNHHGPCRNFHVFPEELLDLLSCKKHSSFCLSDRFTIPREGVEALGETELGVSLKDWLMPDNPYRIVPLQSTAVVQPKSA